MRRSVRDKPEPSGNLYGRAYGFVYIGPAVLVLVAISIVPMLYSIGMSLTDLNLIGKEPTQFIGLGNYIRIFTDKRFWQALARSLLYVAGVVSVELVLGFAMALLFQVRFRGKKIVRSLLILPMVATPIAIAFMWRIMYNPNMGILNYLLGLVGVPPQQWASAEGSALLSTMLVDIWQWTPFLFLILTSGIAALPVDCFEAAVVDGASLPQLVRLVMLPLLKPVLAVGLLFRIVDSFKAFDTIYVLTAGGPGSSTETLNLLVFLSGFKHFKMGYACAMSIIMVYLVLFVCNLVIKQGKFDFG